MWTRLARIVYQCFHLFTILSARLTALDELSTIAVFCPEVFRLCGPSADFAGSVYELAMWRYCERDRLGYFIDIIVMVWARRFSNHLLEWLLTIPSRFLTLFQHFGCRVACQFNVAIDLFLPFTFLSFEVDCWQKTSSNSTRVAADVIHTFLRIADQCWTSTTAWWKQFQLWATGGSPASSSVSSRVICRQTLHSAGWRSQLSSHCTPSGPLYTHDYM